MSDTDFAAFAEPVAREFWGEPNKQLSTAKKMAWGQNGGRTVDIEKGAWFDFTTQEGGGVLALVMRELPATKEEALAWLTEAGFLEDRQPENRQQPRQDGRPAPPEDNAPQERPEPPVEPQGALTAVKGYDYTDADGNSIYQVIRYQFKLPDGFWEMTEQGTPKKTFRQRRHVNGSWVYNLEGISHTIYRHPKVEIAIADGVTILLPEGERDVESLEALGFVASTNSGGAKNWNAAMASLFKGADVIIPVDNDDVGRARGEAVAQSLRGIAKRIRVLDLAPHWPEIKPKQDVSDWIAAGGTAAQMGEIISTLPDWKPHRPASKFNATGLADVDKQAAKHSWLVQDMIEMLGSASFAGFTQSGKSFLMIDLAFCVSRGTPFWGRPVTQGLVIYQVGEGELGFFKRVQGYQQDRGFADDKSIPIEFLPKKVNLFVDDKDTDALIAECKALEAYHGIKLRLVVIDTLNKATRGSNEISGQDNGKIIERIERIARECECTVIVVDHLSAQGRLRGHTSKSDDMTNVVKVSAMDKVDRNGRTIRKFVLDKNKDGEKGGETHFVLRQVTVGFDDLGRPITTCVVDMPDGDVASEVAKGHLSMTQALLLRTIKDTAEISGEAAPPELVQVPPGRNVAKWTDALDRARKTWTFTATDPAKREAELLRIVKDAGNRLYMARYIDRDNSRGLIWWTGKDDRPRQAARPAAPAPISPGMKEAIDSGVPF